MSQDPLPPDPGAAPALDPGVAPAPFFMAPNLKKNGNGQLKKRFKIKIEKVSFFFPLFLIQRKEKKKKLLIVANIFFCSETNTFNFFCLISTRCK